MPTRIEVGDGFMWMIRCEWCDNHTYSERKDKRFCSHRCQVASRRFQKANAHTNAHKPEGKANKPNKSDKMSDSGIDDPGFDDPAKYRVDPPDAKWYYLLDGMWSLIGDGSECCWQQVPKPASHVDHITPGEAERRNAQASKAGKPKPKK
jgi:hypothetical protein